MRGLSRSSSVPHCSTPLHSQLHCGLERHSETFKETSQEQQGFCSIKISCGSALIVFTWYRSQGPFFKLLSVGSITFLSETGRKLGITPLFLPLSLPPLCLLILRKSAWAFRLLEPRVKNGPTSSLWRWLQAFLPLLWRTHTVHPDFLTFWNMKTFLPAPKSLFTLVIISLVCFCSDICNNWSRLLDTDQHFADWLYRLNMQLTHTH